MWAKTARTRFYALGDLATIQMVPPGHRSYIIFDANYEDHLAGFAQEHCRKKLITPDLEQIDKVPEHYRDWHHGVQDAIDADVLKRRDTLEELEADLGFAKGVLTDAVAKWNECCEKGETTSSIPCLLNGSMPLLRRRSMAAALAETCNGTKAGLLINDQMQVVGTNGLVIPGLYAGWHTAGGACGENSYRRSYSWSRLWAMWAWHSAAGICGNVGHRQRVLGRPDMKTQMKRHGQAVCDLVRMALIVASCGAHRLGHYGCHRRALLTTTFRRAMSPFLTRFCSILTGSAFVGSCSPPPRSHSRFRLRVWLCMRRSLVARVPVPARQARFCGDGLRRRRNRMPGCWRRHSVGRAGWLYELETSRHGRARGCRNRIRRIFERRLVQRLWLPWRATRENVEACLREPACGVRACAVWRSWCSRWARSLRSIT